jgi:hypothetical protein
MPDEYAGVPSAAALTSDASTKYIVAWESVRPPEAGAGYDIAARFVQEDGTLGERMVLNSAVLRRDEGRPTIVATREGFIATWNGYDENGADVYVRRFTNDAVPLGEEVRVNTFTNYDQTGSELAASPNGNFVVTWVTGNVSNTSESQDGDGYGLYGQAFLADGSRSGKEFQISTRTKNNQGGPGSSYSGIAFLNESEFVVVWDEWRRGAGGDIFGRRFRLVPDQSLCADSVGQDLTINVTDALGALRASVGIGECDFCNCDVDSSGDLTATDAQLILGAVVAAKSRLACPRCGA